MKVKGKVKLEWEETSISHRLRLHVKFKLPGQIFNRSRSMTLANSWWIGEKDGYEDFEEFWNECIAFASNNEILEGEAKEMIIKYIKEKYKETESDKNKNKLSQLIKAVNKNFEVEVEYEVGK